MLRTNELLFVKWHGHGIACVVTPRHGLTKVTGVPAVEDRLEVLFLPGVLPACNFAPSVLIGGSLAGPTLVPSDKAASW